MGNELVWKISAWAWRKQAAIVRDKNRKEEEDF